MLDHLFSLEGWEASIAIENDKVRLKLLHGTSHERFNREVGVGQAWLVRNEGGPA